MPLFLHFVRIILLHCYLLIYCCCCDTQMYLTLLFNLLQEIIWIGPVKFRLPSQVISGGSKLVSALDKLTQSNCKITVIGNMACQAVMKESSFVSDYNMVENASAVWEFLKGRKLPSLMALDRVCFLSSSPLILRSCNCGYSSEVYYSRTGECDKSILLSSHTIPAKPVMI